MDAARTLFKHSGLIFAAAFLVVVPELAAQPTLTVSTNSITIPGNQPTSFTVGSSGAAITFTHTTTASAGFAFTATPTSNRTEATFTVQATNATCQAFGNPCTGTIVITNTANAADVHTVTVAYSASGGGGGGGSLFSASATTVSLTSTAGSIPQANVTLSSNSSTPLGINVGAPVYTGVTLSWLSTSVNPSQVSLGNNATLTLTGTPTGLPAGTYTATVPLSAGGQPLSITVNLTVGGSSGGGTGNFTVNPAAGSTFAYPGGPLSLSFTVNSSNTGLYTATLTSTNDWLKAYNSVAFYANTGVPVTLDVDTAVAAVLQTGTYTGTVNLVNYFNNADTGQFTVTLNVNGGGGSGGGGSFTPSSLTFNAADLSSTPQPQLVTVNSTGIIGVTNPATCNWVAATQYQSANTFYVLVFPSAVSGAGTYTCNIPFTSDGNAYGSLPVTLVVGSGSGGGNGGGTISTLVAPTTLNFAYQEGSGAFPPPQRVSVAAPGEFTITVTPEGTTNFIGASSSAGAIDVTVIGGLAAGNYNGTIAVNSTSGTAAVAVKLQVTASPVLTANPSTINLTHAAGGSTQTQSISLSMSDSSIQSVALASNQSWVTLGAASVATPGSVSLTVNPSSLPNGLNSATLTATVAGAANSPMTIPVVVLVSGSTAGNLTLSASQLNFTGLINGSQPASQTLTVSAASTTSFTASVPSSGCSWLTVSPLGSTTTNRNLTVSVNQAGLAANTYTCNISLTSGSTTQTVSVSLTVTTTGGNISASPTSMSFTAPVGGGSPGVQQLNVTSASGSAGVPFTVTATTTSGGNWLNPGVNSGTTITTAVNLTVSVNPAGLAAGTYQGNIQLSPSGGQTVNVPVTLTVQGTTVSATPTSLSFAYRVGDQAPAGKVIQVSGGAGLSYSATASSTGGWLSVSPAAGTVGTNPTVSVNPANLTVGTYNGTVTIAGTGSASGSTTVNVTIEVTAPLPTITRVTNAASYAETGTIAAGEIITIFGTAMGPSTLISYTLDQNGRFATTLSNVQVLVGGYPAPLIYVRNDQISAIVPYEISSPFLANPSVLVRYLGQSSNGIPARQVGSAPGMFAANASGSGPGAILNGNSQVNSPGLPANKLETIQIFITGEGQTTPPGVTGRITTVTTLPNGMPFTPQPVLPIAVLIDGLPAAVTFWGEAPSLVAGVLQINAVVPANARSGNVPIQVSVGGVSTQPGITVSVR